jgi:hypothetical protein
MRSSKSWLIAFAFLFMFALSASSAMATSYVRPSGNGAACSTIDPSMPSTPGCVDVSGNILTFGTSPTLLTPTPPPTYQIVGAVGVTSGTEVDFTFAGPAPLPLNNDSSTFKVLACGYGDGSLLPGIYTSSASSSTDSLSGHCTALGDPNDLTKFMDPSQFITDDNCSKIDTICLSFSQALQPPGPNLPADWYFTEASTGPSVLSLTETFGPAPASTPEPASLSLLAVGLVGLGIFRRKRAA